MQEKVASSCQAVLEALPRQISPTSAAFWRAAFWRAHMLRDFQALRQQYHTLYCCRRAGLRPLQRCYPARHGSLRGELCTLTCCHGRVWPNPVAVPAPDKKREASLVHHQLQMDSCTAAAGLHS